VKDAASREVASPIRQLLGLRSYKRFVGVSLRDQGQGLQQLLGRGPRKDPDRQFLQSAGQTRETYPASGIPFAAARKLTKRSVEASRFPGCRLAIGNHDVVDDRAERGGDIDPVEVAAGWLALANG
jgi:hypothetical protein